MDAMVAFQAEHYSVAVSCKGVDLGFHSPRFASVE